MSDTEQNAVDTPAAEPEQTPAAEPVAEPAAEPAAEPKAEPAAEPAAAEPAAEETKPAAEPAAPEPAAEPAPEPTAAEAEPVSKPEEVAPAADVTPAAEGAEAKDEEPKPKPAKNKREGDLKLGFLQKYGASLFAKGWKHSLVALTDEGRQIHSWNFARDYNKKPAAVLSLLHSEAAGTYEEDKTPKKPAAHGEVANNFFVRIAGKLHYFAAETEEEAKAWLETIEEHRKKHYVEKPPPREKMRASKKEKSPKAAAEGGATADHFYTRGQQ